MDKTNISSLKYIILIFFLKIKPVHNNSAWICILYFVFLVLYTSCIVYWRGWLRNRKVSVTGTQSAAGRQTVYSQRSSHAPCEKRKKLKMSALTDLWPGGPLGDDQKVHDYILEGIKTKNYGVEIVTSAFVEDLKKLLHLKKSRHEPTPNSCLSREQLCHILGYLVWRVEWPGDELNGIDTWECHICHPWTTSFSKI